MHEAVEGGGPESTGLGGLHKNGGFILGNHELAGRG